MDITAKIQDCKRIEDNIEIKKNKLKKNNIEENFLKKQIKKCDIQ